MLSFLKCRRDILNLLTFCLNLLLLYRLIIGHLSRVIINFLFNFLLSVNFFLILLFFRLFNREFTFFSLLVTSLSMNSKNVSLNFKICLQKIFLELLTVWRGGRRSFSISIILIALNLPSYTFPFFLRFFCSHLFVKISYFFLLFILELQIFEFLLIHLQSIVGIGRLIPQLIPVSNWFAQRRPIINMQVLLLNTWKLSCGLKRRTSEKTLVKVAVDFAIRWWVDQEIGSWKFGSGFGVVRSQISLSFFPFFPHMQHVKNVVEILHLLITALIRTQFLFHLLLCLLHIFYFCLIHINFCCLLYTLLSRFVWNFKIRNLIVLNERNFLNFLMKLLVTRLWRKWFNW